MKRISFCRILYGVLTLAVFCAFVRADTKARAPQFTARTLDGETLTNASISGRVVLIQFWATWCPYCRRDQPAVDHIERMFAGQGLIVIAVDVGESESTVRKYLQGSPRSCRVSLDENHKLSTQFGMQGYPYYVLIDREGRIAGTQNGAGGEASLLSLLSHAGLSSHPETQGGHQSSTSSPSTGKSKVIEVQRAQVIPAKAGPKTVFVLASGERLEADQYTLDAGFLHLVAGGRTIAMSELDMKATLAVNHDRGIDLKIPQSRSEVFVAF